MLLTTLKSHLGVKSLRECCRMCFKFRFNGLMRNFDNKVGHLVFSAKTPTLLYACSKQSHMDLKDPRSTAGMFRNLC